jgi:hypothetical protein
MPKSCIICNAVASPDLQLLYCARCQSALYCSKACQKIDWREKQHRQICKFLNVGHGDRQVRTAYHTSRQSDLKEVFEGNERSLGEGGGQRFFKLFQESTFEGSQAAAETMTKFAIRQPEKNHMFLLMQSLRFLIRFSKSEMLSWPNNPLLVMLQFVDPNVWISGDVMEASWTLLHMLADKLDSYDYTTHVNQLILAEQLVERGANVNAVSSPKGLTPLHEACYSSNVTNLDFVEFLLNEGTDPNAQDNQGLTPLMCTIPAAPGAAKFLLNWPTTDANITTRSGASFLAKVRQTITQFSGLVALPHNPERLQHQLVLQQWSEIETMLVERDAVDTGITAFE